MHLCPFSVKKTYRCPQRCLDCHRAWSEPATHANTLPSSLHRGPPRRLRAHTTQEAWRSQFPSVNAVHACDHDPHPLAVMNLHCMTRVCVSLTSDFSRPVSSFALLQADKVSDFMQHTRSHSLWVEAAFSPHAPKMLLLDPEPGDLSFLTVKRRPGLELRLGEPL